MERLYKSPRGRRGCRRLKVPIGRLSQRFSSQLPLVSFQATAAQSTFEAKPLFVRTKTAPSPRHVAHRRQSQSQPYAGPSSSAQARPSSLFPLAQSRSHTHDCSHNNQHHARVQHSSIDCSTTHALSSYCDSPFLLLAVNPLYQYPCIILDLLLTINPGGITLRSTATKTQLDGMLSVGWRVFLSLI